MKNLLKNAVPAAVAVFAIAGAFATTSMQSASKSSTAIQFGRIQDSNGKCLGTEVPCSDIPKPQMCRLDDLTGPQAYEHDEQGNCYTALYRVVDNE